MISYKIINNIPCISTKLIRTKVNVVIKLKEHINMKIINTSIIRRLYEACVPLNMKYTENIISY